MSSSSGLGGSNIEMQEDKTFYTVTMASLLARQGKLEEAARIYRFLLEQTPDRADIRQRLEELLERRPCQHADLDRILPLVKKWVQLLLKQKELSRLKALHMKKGAG